jgi:calcineurin-like phosphoesterase
MTGPLDSVIGMKREVVLRRFLTQMPTKFEVASGRAVISGAVVNMNPATGKALSIERLRVEIS